MQIYKSKVNGGVKHEKIAYFFDKYSMCYFANETVIVSELPDGYSYAGELTDQEKEFAYINGEKYYLPTGTESIEEFYVYQECGTPVTDQEIDNTKRQTPTKASL